MALDVKNIHKPLRKLRKLLKKLSNPPAPEQVHELRTASRKLETSFHVLSLASRGNERRILKHVARLRKRAGKVRDMDVLTSYAANVHAEGEDECAIQLLEQLGANRKKYAKTLRSTIRQYGPGVRRRLKLSSTRVDTFLRQSAKDSANRKPAPAEAAVSVLKLSSELSSPSRLGRASLHPYRLKVKELRNLLQMADNMSRQDLIDELGKAKDAIGEWHDWEELIGVANDALDHAPRCRLLRELKRISNEKYEHALTITENMRRKYFRSHGRSKRGSPTTMDGLSEPVLLATRSLAA